MKKIVVSLKSVSPYSQSRYHQTEKLNKEGADEFEKRTWRERLHYNEDGNVFISPITFKNCLSNAALFMSMQIKGKGKRTYTKHFKAGVLVVDPLVLSIKKDEVGYEDLFLPSDGKAGSGTRVMKRMTVIHEWGGDVEFLILDDIITEDVFKEHIICAGQFIGIGRFRPQNGGYYGRFEVEEVKMA